jgi:hypothetical protein
VVTEKVSFPKNMYTLPIVTKCCYQILHLYLYFFLEVLYIHGHITCKRKIALTKMRKIVRSIDYFSVISNMVHTSKLNKAKGILTNRKK